MTVGGTQLYSGLTKLPPLVTAAVELARDMNFELSCRPEQGRLLALLAAGVGNGVIGETGTGCGVGLAWLLSGASDHARVVSVERDEGRASAVAQLLEGRANVTVIHGDAHEMSGFGPFDLLVLDGGGSGKTPDDTPLDPRHWLRPFGTLVIDDFTPMTSWPPLRDDVVDQARMQWLVHPSMLTTEVVVCPSMSTIVGVRHRG
jgi:predicted O-methyltransferase YrrM